ncbi:MAG: MFS transporter [Thermoactinospora sp.]|nr:MFS transporter [Thermoactinospora sp.]
MGRFVPKRWGSSFRWLLGSSWSTNFGDGVAMAAAPLLIASLTKDPFLISLGALIGWAPPMVFSLYAGVLSDRLNRRRIMMVANAARLVVLAGLVTMIATGTITVASALAALALMGVAEVFVDNTASTLAPMLVPRDDLALANSRLQTGFLTLNQLAGPPLGALLFTAGAAWPFAGQLLLAAAGLVMISRIVLPAHGRENGSTGKSVLHDLREGFLWTVRHAAVRTLVLTILIFNVTFGAAWSVLVLYSLERLGLGSVGFGLLTTIMAVGGLIGTALYGAITRRFSLGVVMRAGLIIETLTHLGLALATSAWVAFPIFLVFGAHAFIWGATSVTVRQRAVPTELQGRVGSVNTICVFGGLVVGSLIGGALASHYGVTAPFWFAFAGSAVFVVALWRQLLHIAHDDEAPAQVTPSTP